MSDIIILKGYIKNQANIIKSTKQKLKEYQRDHGGYDGGFFKEIKNLAWDYRHHHIAYSLIKGTFYENIENPRENNKPDMDFVQEIANAYKTTKNVCASTPGLV